MNERIKELYLQTAEETAEGKEWAIGGMKNAERFAELIVRECADIVEKTRWMVQPSQEQIARSIKQHFGVE